MKRQANHSVLKSTGATVLSPGPRTFGEQRPGQATGAPVTSGVEDARAFSDLSKEASRQTVPERRERSGSVSRAPVDWPKSAAPVDVVPSKESNVSGVENQRRPPRGRSNSGLQLETGAAGKATASASKNSADMTVARPQAAESFPSESSRRGRRPSKELQQAMSLDEELEALLKTVEPTPLATKEPLPLKEPTSEPSKEPKEPPKSAKAAGTAQTGPDGQERCSVCGAQFQQGQSIYESTIAGLKQVLCSGCWSDVAPHCVACGKLISGPMAKVGDDAYHQQCLKCAICSKVIDGALSKLDCGICCGACTDEVDKDLRELRRLLSAGDFEGAALVEGSLKARGIKPPEQKSRDLGRCSSCQLPFKPGQQVYEKDGDSKMLCEACFLSAAPACAACGKPVVGMVAKVGDDSYHPECLICSSCGGQISGSFAKTDTGFMCTECQAARAS
ncbi:limB [Symbiodinium sp. CCMP2592]|nr:limB [Symbiodinium sp. CCMP2592]